MRCGKGWRPSFSPKSCRTYVGAENHWTRHPAVHQRDDFGVESMLVSRRNGSGTVSLGVGSLKTTFIVANCCFCLQKWPSFLLCTSSLPHFRSYPCPVPFCLSSRSAVSVLRRRPLVIKSLRFRLFQLLSGTKLFQVKRP